MVVSELLKMMLLELRVVMGSQAMMNGKKVGSLYELIGSTMRVSHALVFQ